MRLRVQIEFKATVSNISSLSVQFYDLIWLNISPRTHPKSWKHPLLWKMMRLCAAQSENWTVKVSRSETDAPHLAHTGDLRGNFKRIRKLNTSWLQVWMRPTWIVRVQVKAAASWRETRLNHSRRDGNTVAKNNAAVMQHRAVYRPWPFTSSFIFIHVKS